VQSHATPILYGLLFVDKRRRKHANIRGGGDPLDIYLRCAILCARSVAHHGYKFRLVTNDRLCVERRIHELGLDEIDLFEQAFSLSVPNHLPFWAAHRKLELYRFAGSGRLGEQLGIIDIDTVMISAIDFPSIAPGSMLAYDITNQVISEFGYEKVLADLQRVSGKRLSECRWFGGEFLFGHAESFQRLAETVFRLWPSYIEHVNQLHHMGDEVLLSAAIPSADLSVMDAGQLGFIARWWTARTNFKQVALDIALKQSILHLPSDKRFLAKFADTGFRPNEFIARFKRAARGKLFRRRVFNVTEMLLYGKKKYVARLS
jgi:hypothetical protein